MADKTHKIENKHADEEIEVSGSQISSESDENQQPDELNAHNRQASNMPSKPVEVNFEGGYDPSDYANLPVSGQVKEIFKMINRYTPVLTELDAKLKAFIPDYIPAIGEVDAFLKMPRPDGQPQTLGLYVMDEPALNQSDKAKIDLMMANNTTKYRGSKYSKIHSIKDAEKNTKKISQWINSVADIHKNKQPHTVSYSKPMPDINSLMQVWGVEVEEMLSELVVPSEEIDLSLQDYSKVACNVADIPVHRDSSNSAIEALHVLFTLFNEFNTNEHFKKDDDAYMHQG